MYYMLAQIISHFEKTVLYNIRNIHLKSNADLYMLQEKKKKSYNKFFNKSIFYCNIRYLVPLCLHSLIESIIMTSVVNELAPI